MRRKLSLCVLVCAVAIMSAVMKAATVSDKPDTPFKLTTFESRGKTRVGMVVGDRVLDLGGANTYVTKSAGLPAMELPTGMRELIEQYGTAAKRMYQIANYIRDKKV